MYEPEVKGSVLVSQIEEEELPDLELTEDSHDSHHVQVWQPVTDLVHIHTNTALIPCIS